jgi:hypothetical protein
MPNCRVRVLVKKVQSQRACGVVGSEGLLQPAPAQDSLPTKGPPGRQCKVLRGEVGVGHRLRGHGGLPDLAGQASTRAGCGREHRLWTCAHPLDHPWNPAKPPGISTLERVCRTSDLRASSQSVLEPCLAARDIFL